MKNHRNTVGAIALISFFALTGAKAEGCGGEVQAEPQASPCPSGQHLEDICLMTCTEPSQPGATDGGCIEECDSACVPNEECPQGMIAQTVCEEPVSSSDSGAPDCIADDCVDPPEQGDCWTECIPANPCGPGFHEDYVCESPPSPSSGDSGEPEQPADCYLTCVPDECPPGSYPTEVCVEDENGELECWTDCGMSGPPESAS